MGFISNFLMDEEIEAEMAEDVDPEFEELVQKYGFKAASEYLYPRDDEDAMNPEDFTAMFGGL